MTTSHLRAELEPTTERSYILYQRRTMDTYKHTIGLATGPYFTV